MSDQYSLFSQRQLREISRPTVRSPEALYLSASSLEEWKQRIFRFQQDICQAVKQPLQTSLLTSDTAAATAITGVDPFSLPQKNIEFWRGKVSEPGGAAFYFVVDAVLPLLLYVGETCHANVRWKGTHDCKRYLLNYIELHRRYQKPVETQIGFYLDAPAEIRDRQRIEQVLIQQWRSPFNKENWKHWGTPFSGQKANP